MKKKKLNKNNNLIHISLFVLIAFFLLFSFVLKNSTTQSKQPHTETSMISEKEYQSSFLKLNFKYPADFQLKEIDTSIYLEGKRGLIRIDSTGTNFDTLVGHLKGLEVMNKVNIIDRRNVRINNLDGISAVIKNPLSHAPDTYSYFFYPTEWTVYSISTDSQELRNDVDTIAQTFVYTP